MQTQISKEKDFRAALPKGGYFAILAETTPSATVPEYVSHKFSQKPRSFDELHKFFCAFSYAKLNELTHEQGFDAHIDVNDSGENLNLQSLKNIFDERCLTTTINSDSLIYKFTVVFIYTKPTVY